MQVSHVFLIMSGWPAGSTDGPRPRVWRRLYAVPLRRARADLQWGRGAL